MISFIHDGDTATAARQMQRALALDPDSLVILGAAEDIAKSLGHLEEAVALNEYMVARDPMLSNVYSQLGLAYLQAGRLDESIASNSTALDMEPGQMITHYFIGSALLLKGDAQAALVEMQKEPFEAFRLFGLRWRHSLATEKIRRRWPAITSTTRMPPTNRLCAGMARRDRQRFEWSTKRWIPRQAPHDRIEPLFTNLTRPGGALPAFASKAPSSWLRQVQGIVDGMKPWGLLD